MTTKWTLNKERSAVPSFQFIQFNMQIIYQTKKDDTQDFGWHVDRLSWHVRRVVWHVRNLLMLDCHRIEHRASRQLSKLEKLSIFLFYSSKQSFNWLKWQNEKKYEDKLYILLRSSTGENPEPWNIIGLTENKRWKVPNPVHGSWVPSPRPQLLNYTIVNNE